MDRVILLYFDGSLSEQFELVGMRLHMLTFGKHSSFNELVARVRAIMNIGCDLRLHRRYDMGSNRLIYVMLPLLKGAEAVTEMASLSGGEITMHETGTIRNMTFYDILV
jgi:hypothetical protein